MGFGDGTVSAPAAAVRTLKKGLRAARNIVPTVEDLRDELRARLAEQRKTQVEETRDRPRPAPPAPDALAATRGFVNTLNQTAAATEARLGGEAPPPEAPNAHLQINGQTTPYIQAAQPPPTPTTAARLDVFV